MSKGTTGLAIIALVVVAGLAGYLVVLSGQRTSSSATGTPTPSSTRTSTYGSCTALVTISGYNQYCASPLNYTTFRTYVNESSSIKTQNGAIVLSIGYHPCIFEFYVLPNSTDVEVYWGTSEATQTCA